MCRNEIASKTDNEDDEDFLDFIPLNPDNSYNINITNSNPVRYWHDTNTPTAILEETANLINEIFEDSMGTPEQTPRAPVPPGAPSRDSRELSAISISFSASDQFNFLDEPILDDLVALEPVPQTPDELFDQFFPADHEVIGFESPSVVLPEDIMKNILSEILENGETFHAISDCRGRVVSPAGNSLMSLSIERDMIDNIGDGEVIEHLKKLFLAGCSPRIIHGSGDYRESLVMVAERNFPWSEQIVNEVSRILRNSISEWADAQQDSTHTLEDVFRSWHIN